MSADAETGHSQSADARATMTNPSDGPEGHLKLQITKLRREQYGASAERNERQLAQFDFPLEDLEADAADDERAAAPAYRPSGLESIHRVRSHIQAAFDIGNTAFERIDPVDCFTCTHAHDVQLLLPCGLATSWQYDSRQSELDPGMSVELEHIGPVRLEAIACYRRHMRKGMGSNANIFIAIYLRLSQNIRIFMRTNQNILIFFKRRLNKSTIILPD